MRLTTWWILLLLLSATVAAQTAPSPLQNHDPEAAIISADDVTLFWRAYDLWIKDEGARPDKLAGILQKNYLDAGSKGVKDFIPDRIISAEELAREIVANRDYYERIKPTTEQMVNYLPEIRQALKKLKRLYTEAIFPPVYLVIGRRNSGGTSTSNGLIIGTEMFGGKGTASGLDSEDVVPVVVHELIHFQQKSQGTDLLSTCLREGAADFITEQLVGRESNSGLKSYGDIHEEELWRQFQQDIERTDRNGAWLYNRRIKERVGPPDLGYYMGYKIAQSYYEGSTDKTGALISIIEMREPRRLFERSNYGQKFLVQPAMRHP